jgi:predicted short-subunit dehydrogenase-like oxidoreductase (DUF2520 family)
MLPGMKGKSGIAIVGAGNLANALAISLREAGYEIEAIVGRPTSQARARRLAATVAARAFTDLPRNLGASVVWFCVPDGEIRKVSNASANKINWTGRVALHSSGALASDELDALRKKGAAIGSVHPLMTFVRGSRPKLTSVPFVIEGDRRAAQIAKGIVKELGGRAYSIRKEQKAAYHAWGTFASPLLTALLAASERVAGAAGIPKRQAQARMIPILRQTLENYASFGAAAGFSGPIIRGDIDTVKRHLRVLRGMPQVGEVYRALALAAVENLPGKRKAAIRKALKS